MCAGVPAPARPEVFPREPHMITVIPPLRSPWSDGGDGVGLFVWWVQVRAAVDLVVGLQGIPEYRKYKAMPLGPGSGPGSTSGASASAGASAASGGRRGLAEQREGGKPPGESVMDDRRDDTNRA
jgi:hypothetical protein